MTTPGLPAPGNTGAIHDIGYRHYDGPRLGTTYIGRALFVHSLRGAFGLGRSPRTKVMPFLLLAVMVVPTLLIATIAIVTNDDHLPVRFSEYAFHLQVVIAVFVGSQAPQSVSRDLRFRLVSLYFSRPLSRRNYVQAKLLAMTAALFVLIGLPVLVLYIGSQLAQMTFWDNTKHAIIGLASAAIYAVVLASIGLVIAAFTPRRGLGVAAVVAVVLGRAGVAGTVQGFGHEQHNDTVAGYAGLISPFSLVDGVTSWVFGERYTSIAPPPGTSGGIVFVLATIGLVAGCYGLLMLRYRKASLS